MTVYVDDSLIPAKVGRLESKWSHLFADSEDELHQFAAKLGLRREWFQEAETTWHYDVTEGKRAQAVALGAQAVSWRQSVRIIRNRDARRARPGRHSWQGTSRQHERQCESCGTVAIRRMHPAGKRWLTTYWRDGRAIAADHVPPCGEPLKGSRLSTEERSKLADEADMSAGFACHEADTDRAARLLLDARVLDPGRAALWDQREQRIREAAARRQPQTLERQTQERLRAAGVSPGDPGLKFIRGWNEAARERAIRAGDREAASDE